MIQVGESTWVAMQRPEIDTRYKVDWRLGHQATGLDVTDLVLDIQPISRTLGAVMSGYTGTGTTITLANDGRFTYEAAESHTGAPFSHWLYTEITVEHGVKDSAGVYEYVPVFVGRVVDASYPPGQIVLQVVGPWTELEGRSIPQDCAAFDVLSIINSLYTDQTKSHYIYDYITYGNGSGQQPTGWPIYGSVRAGTAVSEVIASVNGSMMITATEDEVGQLLTFNEYLPRDRPHALQTSSGYFPITIDPDVVDVVPRVSLSMLVTELIVSYALGASYIKYRDADRETYAGRITRTVALPYAPNAWQAMWAARVMMEYLNAPVLYEFTAPGFGLPIQLNDRVQIKDPLSGTVEQCRVVAKSWSPDGLSFAALRETAESSIFEATYDQWGVSTWDAGDWL